MMRIRLKWQRGITLVGLLITLIIVGFLVLSGSKLVPIYFEHYKVQQALKILATQKLPAQARLNVSNNGDIKKILLRKLYVDNVRSVKAKNISVEPDVGGIKVTVSYEVRKHFLANLDIVAKFLDQTVLKRI